MVRIGERRPMGGGEVLEQPAVSTGLDPRDLRRGAPLQHGRPWVERHHPEGRIIRRQGAARYHDSAWQSAPAMSACAALLTRGGTLIGPPAGGPEGPEGAASGE